MSPRSAALQQAMKRLGTYDSEYEALISDLVDDLNEVLAPETDLWDCCPNGADCWRPKVKRPESPHHYRVPYVGPDYRSNGILLAGMNSRDDGRSDAAYRGMADYIDTLRAGQRRWGGFFQYRAAQLVGMMSSAQRGERLDGTPSYDELAIRLLESARIQAVQCAPVTTERRSPTGQMWSNCPTLIAERQIQRLQPRAIALLGKETHRHVQRFETLQVEWQALWHENENCFARGTADVGGPVRASIFALYHPSYVGGWSRSLRKLRDSLEAEPIVAPDQAS